MSKRERRRLEVLSQVVSQQLTLQKGSELLGIGYRQMKRLWSRYQAEGDSGLVHGGGGGEVSQPFGKTRAFGPVSILVPPAIFQKEDAVLDLPADDECHAVCADRELGQKPRPAIPIE